MPPSHQYPKIYVRSQTLSIILESWFMQEVIFGGFGFCLEHRLNELRNGVVAYLEVFEPHHDTIDQLIAQSNRVVLVQMGDEVMAKFDRSAYLKCEHVVRNYFFSAIFNDPELSARVHWIPNGFRTGVGPRPLESLRPSTARRRLAIFMGWLDNPNAVRGERGEFKAAASRSGGQLDILETAGFSGGFSPALYAAHMEDSIFAPCPAGNAAETIRLYDSLELGCIPITTPAEYLVDSRALPDPPFPVIKNWSDLPELLRYLQHLLKEAPGQIDAMQEKCTDWWQRAKYGAKAVIPGLYKKIKSSYPGY